MPQLVDLTVERPDGPRDRLTALFRPVLVIPHALLVGGPFVGLGAGGLRTGGLGILAMTIALFDWVAILATGQPIAGLQALKRLYLQWRAGVLVYATRDTCACRWTPSPPAWGTTPSSPPCAPAARSGCGA
jgi:hypothetical protein